MSSVSHISVSKFCYRKINNSSFRNVYGDQISSVQFISVAQSCPTLCDPMNRSMPGFPVHHQLLEFTQTKSIESVMQSSHLILCRPLLLPSIFPSIRVFSNEAALHIRRPKYWSFSLNISPSLGYNPSPFLGYNPQYRV